MRNTWTVFNIPLTLLPLHYTGRPRSQSTFSEHVKMLSLALIIQMSTKQGQDMKFCLYRNQPERNYQESRGLIQRHSRQHINLRGDMLLRHRIVLQTIKLCSARTSILLHLPQIEPEFSRAQPGTAMLGKQQDRIYFATRYYSWNVTQSWCRLNPRCRPAALEISTVFTFQFSKPCSTSAIRHSQFSQHCD